MGRPFAIGAKVRLRHCAFGEPGTVLRNERGKLVILWHDLDYLGRHRRESLMLAAEWPQADAAGERAVIRSPWRGRHEEGDEA
jgi:hypothetical protein